MYGVKLWWADNEKSYVDRVSVNDRPPHGIFNFVSILYNNNNFF